MVLHKLVVTRRTIESIIKDCISMMNNNKNNKVKMDYVKIAEMIKAGYCMALNLKKDKECSFLAEKFCLALENIDSLILQFFSDKNVEVPSIEDIFSIKL